MKGLIFKDLINLKTYVKSLGLVASLFLIISIVNKSLSFFLGYIMMMSITVMIATFSYDEKVEWNHYAMTLPIERKDIVKSKYILGFGIILPLTLLIVLSLVIYQIIQGQPIMENENIFITLTVGAIACVMMMLILPFLFKYGSTIGVYVMMGIAVIPMAIFAIIEALNISLTGLISFIKMISQYWIFYPILFILLVYSSYCLSIRIINKKEF